MTTAMQNQKAAVESGQWLLYRYNPAAQRTGENPLQLDSPAPKIPVGTLHVHGEPLQDAHQEQARRTPSGCCKEAQNDVDARWKLYEYLAATERRRDS